MKRCIEAVENQLRKEVMNTEYLRTNSKKIKELSITLDALVKYVIEQETDELAEQAVALLFKKEQ